MAFETAPAGQASDGRGLVLFVPTIANPAAPTVAELTAGTVKKITYSLVAGGFRHETTENTINDERYTMKQDIEQPGTVTDSLEVQYVSGSTAETTLTPGVTGFIVHRLGPANEVDIDEDDVVDVIPVKAGIQRKVAPTKNTTLQKVQKLFITGEVQRDVAVVDGGS